MTQEVIGRMTVARHVRILEFVRHTLAADLAQPQSESEWEQAEDVQTEVDIERLFACVELLIDRHDQPWSPFVATWHPGLESFMLPRSFRSFALIGELNTFQSAIKSVISDASKGGSSSFGDSPRAAAKALEKVIEKAFMSVLPGDVSELLTGVRDEMLRSLFGVLRIDDRAKVAYLNPLVELAHRQGHLTIATLNYDRSIENAAELVSTVCNTGIETWLASGNFVWPDREGLQLLKLHGSIDWVVERDRARANELPVLQIKKVESESEKAQYERPAIVFGEAGKLRTEGPFLELLLAWSRELENADNLLVVGYSFRDQHVNELVGRWFNASKTRRIIVVDPREWSTSTDSRSFPWFLQRMNRSTPNEPTSSTPRFLQFVGPAIEHLDEAIKAASTADRIDST